MTSPPPEDPWQPPPDDQPERWTLPSPGPSTGPHRDGRPEDHPTAERPTPDHPTPARPGRVDPYFAPATELMVPARTGPPFWLGVVTGVLSPFLLGVVGILLGDAASYLPLLALVGVVALVIHPATRRFGLGTLLGVGILAVVGAGACVLILATVLGQAGA